MRATMANRREPDAEAPATEGITLPYRPPFDWEALHAYLTARAIPGIDVAGDGFYARTVSLAGRTGTITVRPAAKADALQVEIDFPDAGGVPAILTRLRQVFDLDADPVAIRKALSKDPFMAGLVAQRPGLRVPGAWDGFELAVRAILGQQVSVSAATKLAGKLVAAFGRPLAREAKLQGLTHTFPTPEALIEADISFVLNMPRSRGAAIRTVAAAVIAEPDLFTTGQSLDSAVGRLKALRGIGDWTAQYIAMRALREPDAFPAADIGLLRALEDADGRPTPKALLARSEAWRPWRAYAVVQLWAHDAARMEARGKP